MSSRRVDSAGAEEDLIRMDKAEFGLDNLYNKLCSESLTRKERAKQIQSSLQNNRSGR